MEFSLENLKGKIKIELGERRGVSGADHQGDQLGESVKRHIFLADMFAKQYCKIKKKSMKYTKYINVQQITTIFHF